MCVPTWHRSVLLAILLFALGVLTGPASAQRPRRAQPPPPVADTTAPPDSARPPPPPDSVFDRLRTLQGYTPIEYQGRSAEFRADSGVLRLVGGAEVVRGGERLTADTILFFQDRNLVRASGNPQVAGQAQEIAGNVLYYDLDRRRASVSEGRTSVSQGATWYVAGDVTTEGTTRLYATESTFTSDDREEPQYHFEADQIKVIRDRILVGRPARLYFRNVPVFWFPFIVQDLSQGRRSGLLTPDFSVNDIVRTSSGYTRQISNLGFYWAINPYVGAQISGGWRSDSYVSLLGQLQYRWLRQFLNGSLSAEQFWEDDGSRRLSLSTNSSWQPDERTRLSAQGSYASSSSFIRRQSTDPTETLNLNSTFSADRRFDWGNINLGARRSQQITDDRVDLTFPSIGIRLNPVTLFRAVPEQARWYSNTSVNFGSITASRDHTDVGGELGDRLRGLRDQTQTRFAAAPSISVGRLTVSSTGSLNRELVDPIAEIDSAGTLLPEIPGFQKDIADWSANISYRQPLIGSTSVSPFVSLGQRLQSDTLTGGEYLAAPTRLSFGASVNPDLYGFFPGVGPYSAIRHHITPAVQYSYSPEVQQTALQDSVFGRFTGQTQNRVSLGLNQTFEGKLREPRRRERPAADTLANGALAPPGDTLADTTATALPVTPAAPVEAEKVKILAINTSALGYDFVRASRGESGFIGQTLDTRIDSDYLDGLNISFSHDLFDEPPGLETGELGRFAPHLSRLNASFSFGQNSSLFRRIFGWVFADDAPESVNPSEGLVPGTQEEPSPLGINRAPAAVTPFRAAPWGAQFSYALDRPRIGGTAVPGLRTTGQTINGNISFSPTPNWSVNWASSYSVTDGEFGQQRLTLRRNLYRWQADFNFDRTVYGNTSFSVSVRLIDLPDLKVDYRERDLGGSRR